MSEVPGGGTNAGGSNSDAAQQVPLGPDGAPLRGADLARRALEQARAAAKASGKQPGRPIGARSPAARRANRGWSGPGPDGRDPQTLGSLVGGIAKSRGWSPKVNEGTIFGRWASVVGEDIAAHAQPSTLNDKVLHITAESTAWATQLRMIQNQILAKINAAVGQGVVTSLRITGPVAPSWRKGERHVRGRGPRDTYG